MDADKNGVMSIDEFMDLIYNENKILDNIYEGREVYRLSNGEVITIRQNQNTSKVLDKHRKKGLKAEPISIDDARDEAEA